MASSKGSRKRKKSGHLTLRGRFAPGTSVQLVVDTEGADPSVVPVVATAKVRADGSVKFDDLDPGRGYVVRDPKADGQRRAVKVTARGARAPEDSLVPAPDISPVEEPSETPVEPTPRKVHEGQRHTRTEATLGGPLGGLAGKPLPKGTKKNDDRPRVEDAGKTKLVSATVTGAAVTAREFEARQDHIGRTGLAPEQGAGLEPEDDEKKGGK